MLGNKRKVPLSLIFLTAFSLYTNLYSKSEESKEDTPPAKDILTGNTPEQKLFIFRKFNFINGALDYFGSGSVADLNFDLSAQPEPQFYLTPDELKNIPQIGPDPLGPNFWNRFNDIPPTVPLSTTLKAFIDSFKETPPQPPKARKYIPIPTKMEIDILKVLWAKSEATSSDIYAQLDSLAQITAEDLQAILARMVDRGFLDRRKISPSDEFNLFGIVSIEKSSKNRKNQVHLYWPLISKSTMIKYLDSERFLALATASRNSNIGLKSSYQKSLEEKLYLLVQ